MGSKHPVIAGLLWILAHRTDENGKPFSRRSLSRAAGLAGSHVGGILADSQTPNIELETAKKIARAANVRVEWLLTGKGEREPFDESESDDDEPVRNSSILPVREDGAACPSFESWLALSGDGDRLVDQVVEALRREARADLYRGGKMPDVDHWTERYEALLEQKARIDRLREASGGGSVVRPRRGAGTGKA